MLDIKQIRESPDDIKNRLARRGDGFSEKISRLIEIDVERRKALSESETLKNRKKTLSAQVGKLKKEGNGATELMEEVKGINTSIKKWDEKAHSSEKEIQYTLLEIPNIPHDSVPDGKDDTANEIIRTWGEIPLFDFEIKNHVELGEALDIIDMKRAVKIAGSRFSVFKGQGARLMRALTSFMLDTHTEENGYQELYPPFMVNRESMIGTGQLPKFEEDLFKLSDDPYYLIPTAEVPVTNFHRDEILSQESLPVKYTAFTPCFRREAGSYGKDTHGLIRQHQFDKVELVKFVEPDRSFDELDSLVGNAEGILRKLGLAYRVAVLCVGDLGFSAAKTLDLEVWVPSQNAYREISSCSTFSDYQARRAKIRYKKKEDGKTSFVHTINGSGLAVGRLFVALLENFQQSDGSIAIPELLQPYMNDSKKIEFGH
jgi:seryl-tRNA synthetase